MKLLFLPRKLASKIVVAIYMVMAAILFWLGAQPDAYMVFVLRINKPETYPILPVLVELTMLALFNAAFLWALDAQSWARVWKLLACLLTCAAFFVLGALFIVHAPPHYLYFLCAVFLLTMMMLLTLMGYILHGLLARYSGHAST